MSGLKSTLSDVTSCLPYILSDFKKDYIQAWKVDQIFYISTDSG